MAFWNEVKDIFSGEVSFTELTDSHRAGVRVRSFLLLVRETLRSIRRDNALTLASSLAFQTLLALIPVMAISLAFLAIFGSYTPEGAAGAEEVPYTESFIEGIKAWIPNFPGMNGLIESIRDFADNARLVASFAFILLFGTAFSLLNSIEGAFNAIWQVRERRSLLAKGSAFLATLVIVPLLMSLTVYLTTRVARVAEDIEERLPFGVQESGERPTTPSEPARQTDAPSRDVERIPGEEGTAGTTVVSPRAAGEGGSLIKRIFLGLTSLFTTSLALAALYYLMPYTVVRVRAALTGGVAAGVFFEAAIFLFRFYAARFAVNYTQIYGPLLAVPLFLLWIWLVWLIVLFGAEIAFTVQNFRDLAVRAELEKRGISSRIYLAVRTVLAASVAFHRGASPAGLVDCVAEELEVPPYMIRAIITVLVRENVLRRVEPAGEDAYLPAKDITALTVGDVVRAVSSDSLDVPDAPDDLLRQRLAEMFDRVGRSMEGILDTCALSDLVAIEEQSRLDAETRKVQTYN